MSHLVDGCSPDIDTVTKTSDWASQLVTVMKSDSTNAIPVTHVLLTFHFDTAVSLIGIDKGFLTEMPSYRSTSVTISRVTVNQMSFLKASCTHNIYSVHALLASRVFTLVLSFFRCFGARTDSESIR